MTAAERRTAVRSCYPLLLPFLLRLNPSLRQISCPPPYSGEPGFLYSMSVIQQVHSQLLEYQPEDRQVQQTSEHHCHSNREPPTSVGAAGWQKTRWIDRELLLSPHIRDRWGWNLDRVQKMTYNHRLSGNRRTKEPCEFRRVVMLKDSKMDATLEDVCFYQNSCYYSNKELESVFASQAKSTIVSTHRPHQSGLWPMDWLSGFILDLPCHYRPTGWLLVWPQSPSLDLILIHWLVFPASLWTCFITTDLSGDLGSWLNLTILHSLLTLLSSSGMGLG